MDGEGAAIDRPLLVPDIYFENMLTYDRYIFVAFILIIAFRKVRLVCILICMLIVNKYSL